MGDYAIIAVLIIAGLLTICLRAGLFERFRRARREPDLAKLLGALDPESSVEINATLVRLLLTLDPDSMNELLGLYRQKFGAGPARYARRTIDNWRVGKVQPSGQTFNRFLIQLPKSMDMDLKCNIVRRFLIESTPKDAYQLSVTPTDWSDKVTPLIDQIISKTQHAELPTAARQSLAWLSDGDIIAAKELLKRSLEAEARISTAKIGEEIAAIARLQDDPKIDPRIRHVIKLPFGTITLNIKNR